MKRGKNKKLILKITLAILFAAMLFFVGYMIYGNYQMNKLPGLSFEEALNFTLKGRNDAVITVGIIKDGEVSYKVYGENGKELAKNLHTYEIGSLTKTFTAALIQKAISEDKIKLDATIDNYLKLPKKQVYPTIKQLLTHTSGYKGYYFETPMIGNFFNGRNDFCGISGEMLLNRLSKVSVKNEEYPFQYSNFGYAALGLILESVYGEEYTELVNRFIRDELGLQSTQISDGSGDLGELWDWRQADAYLPAGGITSDINDMLAYAQLQLANDGIFAACHERLATINAASGRNQKMGIRMDEIGMSWIFDSENNIIWHNGGTGGYNCYLGIQPETGIAVVVLSNLPLNDRIPATVLGVKLMQELSQ